MCIPKRKKDIVLIIVLFEKMYLCSDVISPFIAAPIKKSHKTTNKQNKTNMVLQTHPFSNKIQYELKAYFDNINKSLFSKKEYFEDR